MAPSSTIGANFVPNDCRLPVQLVTAVKKKALDAAHVLRNGTKLFIIALLQMRRVFAIVQAFEQRVDLTVQAGFYLFPFGVAKVSSCKAAEIKIVIILKTVRAQFFVAGEHDVGVEHVGLLKQVTQVVRPSHVDTDLRGRRRTMEGLTGHGVIIFCGSDVLLDFSSRLEMKVLAVGQGFQILAKVLFGDGSAGGAVDVGLEVLLSGAEGF